MLHDGNNAKTKRVPKVIREINIGYQQIAFTHPVCCWDVFVNYNSLYVTCMGWNLSPHESDR